MSHFVPTEAHLFRVSLKVHEDKRLRWKRNGIRCCIFDSVSICNAPWNMIVSPLKSVFFSPFFANAELLLFLVFLDHASIDLTVCRFM